MRCERCRNELGDPERAVSAGCPVCGARIGTEAAPASVTVLESADPSRLALVRSLLDSAEIPYFIQGEGAAAMLPFGAWAPGIFGRAIAAAVKVPAERADEARALLSTAPEIELEGSDPEDADGDPEARRDG